MINKDSIKIRFFTTLITNILRLIVTFVTGILVARSLGPEEYGEFRFLLGSFIAFAYLLDMASSSAFFTFISSKQRGQKFFIYYTLWIVIQLLAIFIFILLVPDFMKEKIWFGHSRKIIISASFASFAINQIWRYIGQIGESKRDTIGVQVRNISLAIAYLFCVLILSTCQILNIHILFILNIIIYCLFSGLYGLRLYKSGMFSDQKVETLDNIFDEFKCFCQPLILYTLVAFIYKFMDYWLLQKFGGAVQQGYYAVSYKLAFVSLIATNSILQIFWKEIAYAYNKNDMLQVRKLYKWISRSLFFVAALCSCLLIPFNSEIIVLLLGSAYRDAWLPFSLMLLYPIHQSMGQINGTMLFAMGKTKAKSYIGLLMMFVGMLTVYLMLAPNYYFIPGLNLGATGMSLKMIFCQIIEVNLMAFVVSRYLNISFYWINQVSVLLILLPLGFLSKYFSQVICSTLPHPPHILIVMIISATVYFFVTGVIIFIAPSFAGIKRYQITKFLDWVQRNLNIGQITV